MQIKTGKPAPAFSLPDQDGKLHALADYLGKWVLLYFYPKDETPGCVNEACAFRDAFDQLSKHVIILGVSADSVESHKRFREHHRLPFTLLSDVDRTVIQVYGADGILFPKRTSFLIDPKGTIKHIYEKVKPDEHALEVFRDVTTPT